LGHLQRLKAFSTLSCMQHERRLDGIRQMISLLALLSILGGEWGCTKNVAHEPLRHTPSGVKFTLHAPGAKQVSLVGSFNGWAKSATPMKVTTGDLWSVVVPLKAGEYTFMYLVDGVQWVTPPDAEDVVTDGFGQANGVVVVR